MARLLACALGLIAASAARSSTDFYVDVSTLDTSTGTALRNVIAMTSSHGFLYIMGNSGDFGDFEGISVRAESGEWERDINDDYVNGGIVVNDAGTRLYYGASNCVKVIELDNDDVSYTLAGDCDNAGNTDGFGTQAAFDDILDIAIDAREAILYVADNGNCAIKSINIASGEVRTLAGNGECGGDQVDNEVGLEADLYDVHRITVQGDAVFFSDGNDENPDFFSIRRMEVKFPNAVSLFAGSYEDDCNEDECPVEGPGAEIRFGEQPDLVTDAFGEYLFAEDDDNDVVFQCRIADAYCMVIAGVSDFEYAYEGLGPVDGTGPIARFDDPRAICRGSELGVFYVAEEPESDVPIAIRKFVADVRSVQNESPRFTIGVFVAGGAAALLAGLAILNAAPVA